MAHGLKAYRAKRDFSRTPEPMGEAEAGPKGRLIYLIQRHAATRLHYDFRIEHGGVLKSWAVTKAPSRDPAVKRLAVEVEDHPLDYGTFEGTIPSGNYGAGTVQLWDRGEWEPQEPDVDAALERGALKMILHGERLSGGWALVRLKSDRGKPSKRNNWLLIKEKGRGGGARRRRREYGDRRFRRDRPQLGGDRDREGKVDGLASCGASGTDEA
jgi:bifunctional non-homologous end joining protein LigD